MNDTLSEGSNSEKNYTFGGVVAVLLWTANWQADVQCLNRVCSTSSQLANGHVDEWQIASCWRLGKNSGPDPGNCIELS